MMGMLTRSAEEQFEHDLVVAAVVEQYGGSAKYLIHTNPGTEKNVAVAHMYPDIVVTEKGSNKVKFILEVETTNSLEPQETGHWRALVSLGPPLYLIAPQVMLPVAERLCLAGNIRCHFGHYVRDERGRFRIVLKKESAGAGSATGAG
ncbi:hypothetical protein FJY70_05315 [candidate division WOR-3 bacterium]|nr:hypothetical protein [candidate division WOR-3 bacterium]